VCRRNCNIGTDHSETAHASKEINVTRLTDDGPLNRFQIGTIACCALLSALDGMDSQSTSVAAPFIAEGLGIKIADFGPIFSAALLGATVGAAAKCAIPRPEMSQLSA
jgi:hypothetical protein